MASIQKRGKKGIYYAFFRDHLGRRACRCTSSTDRGQAYALALKWEKAASEASRGALTVGKARQVLNEMLALTGQALDQETVREFAGRWVEGKRRLRSAGTAERYGGVVTRFLASLGRSAARPLADIQPADIERHRDALISSGKSAATVRMEVRVIGAMLGQALRQGLIAGNPVSAVELDGTESAVREPFTPEEVAKLLAATVGTPWHGVILFAALTGLRLGDVAALRWGNLKLAPEGEETVEFLPRKTRRTGKVLTLPLHPAVVRCLAELERPEDPAARVFPSLPERTGGGGGLSSVFNRIMDAAGIVRRTTQAQGAGRRVSNKSFHSLRHYTSTELLNSGVDEVLRMQMAGHTSRAVNRKYSHGTIASLRKAVGKLKL